MKSKVGRRWVSLSPLNGFLPHFGDDEKGLAYSVDIYEGDPHCQRREHAYSGSYPPLPPMMGVLHHTRCRDAFRRPSR